MSAANEGVAGAKLLFIGGLTPCREEMLGGLRGGGVEALHFQTPAKAAPRVKWCDFVLYAAAKRADMAPMRKIGAMGKPVAAVLRPEDKGITPLSIESGARAVFVDEVHPEEVFQFARVLGEEGGLRRELSWLRAHERGEGGGWLFPGTSKAAEALRQSVEKAGAEYGTILLEGEKGLNFQAVARGLHARHPGPDFPLLHWGPKMRSAARLERAVRRIEEGRGKEGDIIENGGTLFIEDAQLIRLDHQKALARALRRKDASGEFRLILGSAHDPEAPKLIEDKIIERLRPEGATASVEIPPLEKRKEDISALAKGILDEFSERIGQDRKRITPAAQDWFLSQKWRGNESELEMSVCRAFLNSEGSTISIEDLEFAPSRNRGGDIESFFREKLSSAVSSLKGGQESDFYAYTMRSVEKPLLDLVMRAAGDNQVQAARLLGISRNTLRRKLQEFGLIKTPSPRRRR